MSKTKKQLDLLISRFVDLYIKGTPEQIDEVRKDLNDWAVNFFPKYEKLAKDKGEVYAGMQAAKRLAKHLNLN